ncbi:tetratricopeptide repeat protein [Paraliomyxa miuraensis]|uniref:serine/threonine-protein kinase n=1 Tax=Paraliomyxa miuraensis TaxID=376150 RepID=UPI00224CAECF|nr:serine/threonine-protein kinase [Paraliomyxa miuraensis]MCX4245365.1 serine/threonine-protein kinase [Paraliomyxa miuraensis]
MTDTREPTDTDVDVTRVEPGDDPSTPAVTPSRGPSLTRGAVVGRYVILEALGAGGMGEVFSAYDPKLDRRIALKLVKLEQKEKTAQAIGRLEREAQALAKLSHPNVVAVYDVGTHADRVFIAMEYVEGKTIRDWIDEAPREETAKRWQEGLALMMQAGRGLAAAHAEGLVHRDFKPANIMFNAEDGRVRVLDFGLARRYGDEDADVSNSSPRDSLVDSLDSDPHSLSSRSSLRMELTQAGTVMGTPAYMAPEQFFGGSIDARTDQFAFCIVLYRVLFGIRPFVGETFSELGRAVARGELREIPKSSPVPRGVRQALLRGLSVGREARHPSMDALLDELERAMGAGRRRLRTVAGIAGGVAIVAWLGAITMASGDAEPPCRGAEGKLAGVWDDDVRSALSAAFEDTGVAYAADARLAATERLDDYAEHWVKLRTQVCEATRVRGDQSEALMDLRIGCLDGKLRDLTALTSVLIDADADVVKNAATATGALPGPDECLELDREASERLQPSDPTLASAVEHVREQSAQAKALGLAGKYDDAGATAKEALAAAREAGYEPALAEVLVGLGELHERKMLAPESRAAYEEALYAAQASGHERVEALALIGLLSVWGMHLSDLDTALRYGKQAEAMVRRLDTPPEMQATIALYRGNAYMAANKFELAIEQLTLAVELSRGSPATERIHLASLNNLAATHGQQGHYREAAQTLVRSLELTEARLGPWHPTVGTNHNNLGVTYSRLEDYDKAIFHSKRALEVYTRSLGPDHPEVGRGHHNLGVVQAAIGEIQSAYESYKKALDIKSRGLGPDHMSVAFSSNNVGDTLIKLGRPEEALPYLENALRIWTSTQGEQSPNSIYGLVSLSEAYLALNQPAEAAEHVLHALELAEVGEIDPVEIAKARFVAARAVWRSGGDRREAMEFAKQSKVGYEASERPSPKEIATIAAWLEDPE